MKQIFAALFLLLCLPASQAQTTAAAPGSDPAREATTRLTGKYQLDEQQQKLVYTIQTRKLRNLAAIESLKTSDPDRYLAKLESVQKGTQASIQRLLKTPEQVQAYNQTLAEQRRQRSARLEEMKAAGASKTAIAEALAGIYLE